MDRRRRGMAQTPTGGTAAITWKRWMAAWLDERTPRKNVKEFSTKFQIVSVVDPSTYSSVVQSHYYQRRTSQSGSDSNVTYAELMSLFNPRGSPGEPRTQYRLLNC